MDQLIPLLAAWRVMRLGTREVVDALVLPEFRAGAGALNDRLAAWPGSWYWADPDKTRLVLVRALPGSPRPRWLLHATLFTLAVLFALGAGAALAGVWFPPDAPGFRGLFRGIGQFFVGLVQGEWRPLLAGWTFAAPLLAILLVHESGHYFAARRYTIDVSPPYFLPIPPTISPIGTLGAFIRLRSPVLDRRQLLDVGAAGPLAGFVVTLGVLVWGYLTSHATASMPAGLGAGSATSWISFAGEPIGLGDSVLTHLLRRWTFGDAAAVHLSLPAFAGWVGAFITGLNLLPLSQLDGGHILYGLLGRRQRPVAIAAVLGLLALAQLSPNWYVWVAMTFIIGGGRWSHPSVMVPERHVPPSRRWVGLASVVVFILTFVPIPFAV